MRLVAAMLAACCACASAADPPGRAKARNCIPCHGPLGVGTMPDAPHLAGQPRIYLVEQLKHFRSGARKHEVMNVMAKSLTDADIEDLARWFSSVVIEVKEPR